MSIYGIIILPHIFFLDPKDYVSFVLSDSYIGQLLCSVFIQFCVSDLIIGCLDYNSHIKFLEGWVHHIYYIIILSLFKIYGITNSFYAFSWCEIPTLILSVGILCPSLKSYDMFVLSFVAFRVVMFSYFYLMFYFHCSWNMLYITIAPISIILLTHIYWLANLLQSVRKKAA